MAKFIDHISESQQKFIREQKLFFIASAPAEGRVNLSPKGLDCFRILDANTVAYLDLTGSGNETAAHLKENGRATVMFCGFKEKPLILRLYCQGEAITPLDARFEDLMRHFVSTPGQRQIIYMKVESVQSSCGWAVPFYEFVSERSTLIENTKVKGEAAMVEYRAAKNRASIDGLPTPPLA